LSVLRSGEVQGAGATARDFVLFALLALFCVALFAPMVWVSYSSFKTDAEIFASPWSPPAGLSLSGFVKGWVDARMGQTLLNTLIIVGTSVALTLVLSVPASYAFARMRFKGNSLIFIIILTGMMVPAQSTIIPLYTLFYRWKWLDTFPSVISPYIAMSVPSGIFLLRAYFRTVPKELEESARLDGCTRFGVLMRIYLPLVQAGMATVVIFVSVTLFNELLMGMLFLTSDDNKTLAVMLYSFYGKHFGSYQMMFCTLTMIIIPLIAVFFAFQRHFIEGLTAGAIKE
jgi:ABC-type glycerol-3-phosphate transport system permease component